MRYKTKHARALSDEGRGANNRYLDVDCSSSCRRTQHVRCAGAGGGERAAPRRGARFGRRRRADGGRPADPEGSQGHPVRLQRRLPGGAARSRAALARAAQRSRHRQRRVRDQLKAGRINSTKRYYVRFRIEVWQQGESVFAHDYSAAGRDVLVRFPVDTLGDPHGWFPYAARFKDRHGCRLTCMMNGKMSGLLRSSYPTSTSSPIGNQAGGVLRDLQHRGLLPRRRDLSITRIACPATSAASGTQSL